MLFAHHRNAHPNRGGPWGNNHLQTDHIQIDSRICLACGQCISECPRGVIGQVKWFKHSHTHVDRADQCIGCKKCVKACPSGAITESLSQGLKKAERKKPVAQALTMDKQQQLIDQVG